MEERFDRIEYLISRTENTYLKNEIELSLNTKRNPVLNTMIMVMITALIKGIKALNTMIKSMIKGLIRKTKVLIMMIRTEIKGLINVPPLSKRRQTKTRSQSKLP